MEDLVQTIRQCQVCHHQLPLGANPVFAVGELAKLVIVGQAPGRIVHRTCIPWNDKSGDNLRSWLGLGKDVFYDTSKIALMPMGFCYPGTGKSGDLPPRRECAPLWHKTLLDNMPEVELILLVGQYAQQYYLGNRTQKNLTDTVAAFRQYLPRYFPLPHPSPRNNLWQAKNPWFVAEILPALRVEVAKIGQLYP